MLKRPIHPQFNSAVLEGRKFTTIRDKPWTVGVPIMLYNWSGAAYRSKQVDIAVVEVLGFGNIQISKDLNGLMRFAYRLETEIPLWRHEGFPSPEALYEWFGPMVPPGETIKKTLIRFALLHPKARIPTTN